MVQNWNDIRHSIALVLISAAFAFSATIWSTPPSLGYLSILISSGFALLMTLSWIVTFFKTTAGKILILVNLSVCFTSIAFLLKDSGGFENYEQVINICGNVFAAIMTLILGIMNLKKSK